ncbi:PP2C family protein-serine/threonine phosphatase [Streptomyces huasconensis]|uniref:PP2C family protein-serine/threonine phosphatase n=1 Tax=Streptomyces huasconensis TaxID=1854574 RepID=UPI0037024838
MPSHVFADHAAGRPPERGTVDALISQTRRLRGEVDAVRREAVTDRGDPAGRWQRALCELAVHQLDDLDEHLAQLREGPPGMGGEPVAPAAPAATDPRRGALLSRVGSAEWNLLTDEATWSCELYQILGRDPAAPPLSLDELPSLVHTDDQPLLTAMVTDCLVDGKPIDGEFRIVRPGGDVGHVHMMGEPVLAADGSTASMWAVLRDVSALRHSRRVLRETQESLRRRHESEPTQHIKQAQQTGQRFVVERQAEAPPPWRSSLRFPHGGPARLDLAAHYLPPSSLPPSRLPSSTGTPADGDWYDAMELPDGHALLSVGDLTGNGVAATSGMAMLLGAVRGMAVAGAMPGRLMGWLNGLLDTTVRPARGSAICCRYDPGTRLLTWAQAGHPAPLLFRDGTGRTLTPPAGALLGTAPEAAYEQAEEQLRPGDLLLLHTDGLVPRHGRDAAAVRLLSLAPRLTAARTAEDCVRTVVEEFDGSPREDDACLLIARC